MRSLTLALGGLMTTLVALLWACSHFAGPLPILAAVRPLAVPDMPYTAYAKAPPVGTGPRYTVTFATGRALAWLNRSEDALLPSIRLPNRHFPSLPNYQEVVPCAVNRRHQMVGFYRGGGSGAYLVILACPFSYQHGRLHFLPTLPSYQITHAVALNDKGEIVGDALVDSHPGDMGAPTHAVCWLRGKVYDLGTGAAAAINRAGEIVGDSGTGFADYPHPAHALLWTHGYRYDLNNCIPSRSGWVLTSASAINSKGRIVGYGFFYGTKRAFLLTPLKRKTNG